MSVRLVRSVTIFELAVRGSPPDYRFQVRAQSSQCPKRAKHALAAAGVRGRFSRHRVNPMDQLFVEPPRLLLAEANDKKGGFGGIRYLDDTLSLIPTPTTAVGKRIELNPRLSGH